MTSRGPREVAVRIKAETGIDVLFAVHLALRPTALPLAAFYLILAELGVCSLGRGVE